MKKSCKTCKYVDRDLSKEPCNNCFNPFPENWTPKEPKRSCNTCRYFFDGKTNCYGHVYLRCTRNNFSEWEPNKGSCDIETSKNCRSNTTELMEEFKKIKKLQPIGQTGDWYEAIENLLEKIIKRLEK
jgi:hypothetical protein